MPYFLANGLQEVFFHCFRLKIGAGRVADLLICHGNRAAKSLGKF